MLTCLIAGTGPSLPPPGRTVGVGLRRLGCLLAGAAAPAPSPPEYRREGGWVYKTGARSCSALGLAIPGWPGAAARMSRLGRAGFILQEMRPRWRGHDAVCGTVKAHLREGEQAGVGGALPAVLTCLPPTSNGFKNCHDIAGGGRHRRKVGQGDWVQNNVL